MMFDPGVVQDHMFTGTASQVKRNDESTPEATSRLSAAPSKYDSFSAEERD